MNDSEIVLGAEIFRTPSIDSKVDLLDYGPRPCRVVWIHPERRFYVVRFTFPAGSFRETFYFRARTELPRDQWTVSTVPSWKGVPKFGMKKRKAEHGVLSQKERLRT